MGAGRGYSVEWAPVAVRDLDQILDYVSLREGWDRAEKLGGRILERVAALRSNPERCRVVPELREAGIMRFRELILHPYRAVFLTAGKVVSIVAFFDGRRDLRELLVERATRKLP